MGMMVKLVPLLRFGKDPIFPVQVEAIKVILNVRTHTPLFKADIKILHRSDVATRSKNH
jgi:hypothetical protein